MSIVENTSNATYDEANVAQDIWACVITCNYDSSFMVVNEVNSDWFFNSGASKQILHANFFCIFERYTQWGTCGM